MQQRRDRRQYQHQVRTLQRDDIPQGPVEEQHVHGGVGPESGPRQVQSSAARLQHHEHRTGKPNRVEDVFVSVSGGLAHIMTA
jgi:hypothetical protein